MDICQYRHMKIEELTELVKKREKLTLIQLELNWPS